VVLGIGHERRYEAAIGELRRLVRTGALGTLMHAEANFSHDKLANVPESDWRASPSDAPAAGMTAMGVHLTDLYLDLFGPIREVYAATTSRVAYRRTGDVVSVLMRFESGATGYLNAILVTPLYIGLTIFGSEGWAEVRNSTHPDTPGPTTLTVQYRDGRRETQDYEWLDTVREGLETFARAIETGAPYPFTDAQKVGNVAVLEAICRSAATNAPVPSSPFEVRSGRARCARLAQRMRDRKGWICQAGLRDPHSCRDVVQARPEQLRAGRQADEADVRDRDRVAVAIAPRLRPVREVALDRLQAALDPVPAPDCPSLLGTPSSRSRYSRTRGTTSGCESAATIPASPRTRARPRGSRAGAAARDAFRRGIRGSRATGTGRARPHRRGRAAPSAG
jgi:hypothetical protein